MMVVLALFTYFRGYARLLKLVGAYHEDLISGEEQEEMIAQGRSLARRRRYPLPSVNAAGVGVLGVGGGGGGGGKGGEGRKGSSGMRLQQEMLSGPIRGTNTAYTQLKT